MQNRWITYGFLAVMGGALITLAVLQYHWLGSVSEAEKQRLEEGIDASSENFVSDFNEVFTSLKNNFRIQVTDQSIDITPQIQQSYANWMSSSEYADLVSDLYFVQIRAGQAQELLKLNSETLQLEPDSSSESAKKWITENHGDSITETPTMSLRTLPDFGEHTFVEIPIQLLEFINLNKQDGSENLEVQLRVDRLDDIVLIELNNEIITSELIPSIAATYFGDSFNEQYRIAVVKDEVEPYFYYTSDAAVIENPDQKIMLDRLNISNMIMLDGLQQAGDISKAQSDSMHFSFYQSKIKTREESSGIVRHMAQVESHSNVNILEDVDVDTAIFGFRTMDIDTSITTAFVGDFGASDWEFWLSFKAGSLDEFVAKTRNKNLSISFGILIILGISSVMIVVFAQRSRELAEQQMLFVAGVSHELRTPLSVIRSAAENLSEGVVQTEERKKEYARLMLKEGRRLSDMVDQIMEFSGIQTGKRIYNFSEIDIELLVEEVKMEFQPIFEEQGLILEYSNLAKLNAIQGDREALFIAISNLLHNAIKFSNGSDRVILRLDETHYKAGLALRIQVQDFGIGIPNDEQSLVFNAFYRGRESVENQVKGNGIGLSMVQKIAKAHHGEVQLKSTEGEGSTFSMIIPYHT